MRTVAEMRDDSDGYSGGEDAGQKQTICGTAEMVKWVGIMTMDWSNINREGLPT